jgi:Ca2+-binding RTX toxin-like protein
MSGTVVVSDDTALLSGSYWNGIEVTGKPVIMTFSFPTTAPSYDSTVGGFTAATIASYVPFSTAEQAQALAAMGEWAAASGLVFVEVAPGQGDINFGNVNFNTTSGPSYAGYGGIGFYPFGNWNYFSYPYFISDLDSSGDVFMNSQYQNPDGTVAYGTLLHEIGHAIGLKHPTEVVTDYAASPIVLHNEVLAADDPTLTVMATVGDSNPTDQHLKTLDQQAAAAIYGAAGTGAVVTGSSSGSNAVSSWTWNAVTQTLTQTAATANDTIRGSSVNNVIYAGSGDDALYGMGASDVLYGGAGNDTLYGGTGANTIHGGTGANIYYVQSANTTIINATPNAADALYSFVSYTLPANVDALYLYGQGLTGQGNGDHDTMYGDGTYATKLIAGTGGGDLIVGGAGNDTIVAGAGDLLFGNGGADLFEYPTLASAPLNSGYVGDFVAGDTIDLSGIAAQTGETLTFVGTAPLTGHKGQITEVLYTGLTVLEGDTTGSGTPNFQVALYGSVVPTAANLLLSAACYRAGTRLLTDRGERPIEDLAAGDLVMTAHHGLRPIIWTGRRRVDCARHPDPARVWPVRVRAGAFAPDVPRRDLYLSPDHAVFVEGMLIPIRRLINDATILRAPVDHVVWHHVELAEHALLFAEGAAAESYLDTGNRAAFEQGSGLIDLHADFEGKGDRALGSCVRFVADDDAIEPVWRVLADRARALGFAAAEPDMTDDPDPVLILDGRVVRPVARTQEGYQFLLPTPVTDVRLASRSATVMDAAPWRDDPRRLGLAVTGMALIGRDGRRAVPVDHPGLTAGWHAAEAADGRHWRWTDGDAVMSRGLFDGLSDPITLHLGVGATMRYRIEGDAVDRGPVTRTAMR